MENIVEKPSLVKFVSQHVKISEVETLLAVPESSSKSSSPKPKVAKPAAPKPTVPQIPPNTPMPSPEQLRQQAEMMRRNPDAVRRSTPAFAKLTDAQIREYADQMELVRAPPASPLSFLLSLPPLYRRAVTQIC